MQAKFVLVKLCTSMFSKIRASEILSTCYPRNGVYLKIRASEIRASQGPPVQRLSLKSCESLKNSVIYLKGIRRKEDTNA